MTLAVSEWYFAAASGYFMFDLMVCFLDGWDAMFYVHGISCFIVYSLSMVRLPQRCGVL